MLLEMPFAEFDDAAWPLLRVRFEGAPRNDDEFVGYLGKLETYYDRADRRAIIMDTRRSTLKANHRALHAEWVKKHAPIIEQHCAGIAFVMDSAVGRGVLTAILWIQPLPCPHTVAATMEDAEAWCQAQLAKR